MRKTFLAFLVAVFVLSIGMTAADAAWTSGVATTKKICSYTNSTTLAAQTADYNVAYRTGAGETMLSTDYITVTLTGGAKFSTTAPALTVVQSCTELGSACGAGTFAIVGSASGQITGNFESSGITGVGSAIILNSNGSTIFDVSAVTGNVDVLMAAKKGGSGLVIWADKSLYGTTGLAKYLFSAPAVCAATEIVAATDIANVSATEGPYKGFTGAVTSTTGTATSANFQLFPAAIGEYSPAPQPLSAAKLLWTITGSLTGVASVNASGAGIVTSSDSTGSQTGGTINKFAINTAKTDAYASNTTAIATAAATSNDPKPQFVIDGTTAQTARGFTVKIDVLADGTIWAAHTAKAATALYSITRNGVSFVTNSVGARNTIKVTDRSGNMPTGGGNIIVTAWDVNGNSIPESSSATALKLNSHETKSITGTELIARFPTGTPMKYEFAVESSSALATNVKISTDGVSTSTTLYASTLGGI